MEGALNALPANQISEKAETACNASCARLKGLKADTRRITRCLRFFASLVSLPPSPLETPDTRAKFAFPQVALKIRIPLKYF